MTRTPDLITAGEAVIDLIPEGALYRPVPGGAALNTACAAAKLGVATGFFGALSRDALGERLAQTARAAGVDISTCARSGAPCPVSVITLEDGDAQFAIHHKGSAGEAVTPDNLPALDGVKILLLGGFSLIHAPGAETFETLGRTRPTGTLLYLDLNIRPSFIDDPDTYRERLMRLMKVSDILKVSDEDAAWLGADPCTVSPQALLLRTRGAAGATAIKAGHSISAPAPRVQVVDTVGAGDVFNAAWCAAGLVHGSVMPADTAKLRQMLHYAVTAASLSTQSPGASGPTYQEVTCVL